MEYSHFFNNYFLIFRECIFISIAMYNLWLNHPWRNQPTLYLHLLVDSRILQALANHEYYAETYLEPSQTSTMEFFQEIVNDSQPLTIFEKKLHRRCSTGCQTRLWRKNYRSSRLQLLCKIGALREFAKFTGKYLCQSQRWCKELVKKEALAKIFSCVFSKSFENTLFIEYLRATPSRLNQDLSQIKVSE